MDPFYPSEAGRYVLANPQTTRLTQADFTRISLVPSINRDFICQP